MPKPSPTRQRVSVFPTPDLRDLFFWEFVTLSRKDHTKLVADEDYAYGTAHPEPATYPTHKLVYLRHDPDHEAMGQDTHRYRAYYAADRNDQDEYNFEFAAADFAGQRFDTVRRTYVILRSDFSESEPALGTAMERGADLTFPDGYTLAQRQQSRIGEKELDALFVVEVRTFVRRVTIAAERYDAATNGPLFTTQRFYFRGEIYDGTTTIEDAVVPGAGTVAYWQPTANGQISEFQQVSADAWLVTTQDLIPQYGLPSTDDYFGGTVLRSYPSSTRYTWPDVLGADGSANDEDPPVPAADPFEITAWEYKNGGFRYYARPVYSRTSYTGPCPSIIHEEWLTAAQLETAAAKAAGEEGGLYVWTLMNPQRIHYIAPHLAMNVPPVLHAGAWLKADTGTNDPVWGENVGSYREWPATNYPDWPESIVAEVSVQPARGGYLVRHVTIKRPQYYVAP